MTPSGKNLIRNADFRDGARSPKSWEWNAKRGADWRFADDGANDDRTMTIDARSANADAGFSQKLRCKGDQWYRVEMLVEMERDASADARPVLDVAMLSADGKTVRTLRRRGPARTATPIVWREYIHTPLNARRLVLTIGAAGGPATVRLHRAACIAIDDPETVSHPLAVPPPARAHPAPRRVKRAAVIGPAPDGLVEMLDAAMDGGVRALSPADRAIENTTCDGVILCGQTLPRPLRTWRALKKFAEQRIVVISPAHFARLAGGRTPNDAITVRKLDQDEEPIFAKVRDANFVTAGFALLDVFPFGRYDAARGEFTLACLRRTRGLARFVEREGFSITLLSEAATDPTTDLPLCLVRATERGAIVVLDISPIESTGATEPVPQMAATVLLNALGRPQTQAGQFIAPEWDRAELISHLKCLVERFAPLRIADETATKNADAVPTVVCGAPTVAFGLPMKPRPTVVIRTGFSGRDWVGVYGAWQWLKQLTRPAPWQAPHLRALLERCDVRWIPLMQPAAWSVDDDGKPKKPATADADAALCIDVAVGTESRGRIHLSQRDTDYARRVAETWPLLMRDAFHADAVTWRAGDDDEPADFSCVRWRRGWPAVTVERPANGRAAADNAVRVVLPAVADDGPVHSIWRIEQAAVLVETLVGLWAGPMAVNRTDGVQHWMAPAWLNGDAMIIAPDGRAAAADARDTDGGASRTLALPSGHTLLIPPTPELVTQ